MDGRVTEDQLFCRNKKKKKENERQFIIYFNI